MHLLRISPSECEEQKLSESVSFMYKSLCDECISLAIGGLGLVNKESEEYLSEATHQFYTASQPKLTHRAP